jgi:regulator of ribonuclease activity A
VVPEVVTTLDGSCAGCPARRLVSVQRWTGTDRDLDRGFGMRDALLLGNGGEEGRDLDAARSCGSDAVRRGELTDVTRPTRWSTTDLCDDHPEAQVCEPVFRSYGGTSAFSGPIVTLKVFEDDTSVREAVGGPGEGQVLVVDGGGSLRCSLLGRDLAVAATENGWAGVVVFGCVRHVAELEALPIGVRALAAVPRTSERGTHPSVGGRTVVFAEVVFRAGEWLCADRDGIIVLPAEPGPPTG